MKKERERQVEILSPAGSYASFRAALNAGADAVYAGGERFGARAYADNFTQKELITAVREAHLFGKKLYLTVNTLLKDSEMDGLYDYLLPYYENGLDAVIVQDAGVFACVREWFPDLDIHASTQMTITDLYGAKFLEEQGASRVVPARELSLKEIRRIREGSNLEIECFVHGALCYCYSGQCLLSSMIGGRSGNRGQCAQPCRLPYTAGGEKKYFLSPKDICTLELIPDMIEAGIDSFKIEGRMKKPEYVAAVTAMYRKYADLYMEKGREHFHVEKKDREMLMDLYNRGGSSTGYYQMHNGKEMMSLERPNHTGVPAVEVLSQKGREVMGKSLTELNRGDVIGIGGERSDYTLGKSVKEGERISFLVPGKTRMRKGEVLFRIRNGSLIEEIKSRYVDGMKQKKISGFLSMCAGSPASLTVVDGEISCTVCTGEAVQKAERSPLEEEQVRSRMMKTGNTPFSFETLEIYMEDGVFLPMQQLNQLRRSALEQLEEENCARFFRKNARLSCTVEMAAKRDQGKEDRQHTEIPVTVLAETVEQLEAVAQYIEEESAQAMREAGKEDHGTAKVKRTCRLSRVCPDCLMTDDFFENEKILHILNRVRKAGIGVFPALPRIFRAGMEKWFEKAVSLAGQFPADGFLIRNYESFWFLRKHGFDKTLVLDHNLYVFNRYAKQFWNRLGVSMYTAPVELNAGELGTLGIDDGELIVYGYLPVMVSAQCVRKNSAGCTGKNDTMKLTDRYGNTFPVKNYCLPCYNIIYNTVPLWLGGQMKQIRELAPQSVRIQFSVESGEEARAVLERMGEAPGKFRKKAYADGRAEYTTGHFKRGII